MLSAMKPIPWAWIPAFPLLIAGCVPPLELTPSDAHSVLSRHALDAPDPGRPGQFTVKTLYYGSGTDRNRPEYADSVSIKTEPVDASKLVSLGRAAKDRNEYWGFKPEEMPLNARVWYPDGRGPFPLVLVVHGNHNMKDFSDPGYDYLGRLLASRGYILASVDENFINGLRDENDARGWFLLKHIELFESFNRDQTNPFFRLVDMGNIALMGHSRGGEAVANAAALNVLERYPDDATVEFDFGYDIKGLVSIAPVDGQYLPTGRKVSVENVSYLTFHGSHDGDVTSFHGLRIYDRLRFTDDEFHFKAAVYVYRANHGQWNTVWQNKDYGSRSERTLDLRSLIPQEDQRRFAEVYVSAFLDAVLKEDKRYLPIFRDHRVIGSWLPETMYITRFETNGFRPLATFEEDIDVSTGTQAGVEIRGDSLATWREANLELRSSNRSNTSASQENQAVWLGWNNRIAGDDTTRVGPPAAYSLTLPVGLADRWELGPGSTLDLMLGATSDLPDPRDDPSGEPGEEGKGTNNSERDRTDREDSEDEEKPPVDLSVQVEDRAGQMASVVLSAYGPVRRPLETYVLRRRDQEEARFAEHWEQILQTYSIPLADFQADNPSIELRELTAVRLVFDKVVAGEVAVDQIGFSALDPAFLEARVDGIGG